MIFDFPPLAHDDTFRELTFLFPFSLTGLTIELRVYGFKKYGKPNLVYTYTLSNHLKIDASESKRLILETHDLEIEPGVYTYKLKLNPEGIKATYLTGSWTITD
jgi:hypothetical protein